MSVPEGYIVGPGTNVCANCGSPDVHLNDCMVSMNWEKTEENDDGESGCTCKGCGDDYTTVIDYSEYLEAEKKSKEHKRCPICHPANSSC